ncbi:hypothetical protein DXG03_004768 [Asterophora parasitica]|uniref:Uncharacterized protein n=1 Tax=Asterophora parasitica TaxID=117018 RepID=A0A9P7KFK8_9AGAR|nr:hypothetical protein DXG03_004768 [Asterophora parasitica]
MVQYFDEIPSFLFPWIDKQKIFWVATAPLTADGLVNLSAEGMEGSFRVVNCNQSCGYAVPFFTYKAKRNRLLSSALPREKADVEAKKSVNAEASDAPPRPETGLKRQWFVRNAHSQDGLPGMLRGHDYFMGFSPPTDGLKSDDESEGHSIRVGDVTLVGAFLTGVLLTASYMRFIKTN